MERTTFPKITVDAFVADNDRRALAALNKVPLLPEAIRKFHEIGADRWMYCYHIARCVRCGPKQYHTLFNILQESCRILDMPEPELYITGNPFPNAFAGGIERPYIVLRSSIIDTLDDEQMYHLIGHELGHIKAGHILYHSVAWMLAPLLEMIGRRTFGLGDVATYGLVMALAEFSRQSELTADRAGLLVSQSLDVSIDANLALTAGPNRFRHEMNRDAFIDQARAYQDLGPLDSLGKFVWFMMQNYGSSHPMPVHRTKELERWVLTGEFDKVMRGEYKRAA